MIKCCIISTLVFSRFSRTLSRKQGPGPVCFVSVFRLYVPAFNCAVPEKIHPLEGHRKFLGGRGVLNTKILEARYEA